MVLVFSYLICILQNFAKIFQNCLWLFFNKSSLSDQLTRSAVRSKEKMFGRKSSKEILMGYSSVPQSSKLMERKFISHALRKMRGLLISILEPDVDASAKSWNYKICTCFLFYRKYWNYRFRLFCTYKIKSKLIRIANVSTN